MRAFVFVSCFVALAIARPEAGYSYNAPAQAPAPVYSAPPAPVYSAPPPPVYSAPPAPVYSAPAPVYSAPAPSYQTQSYQAPSYSDSSVVGASYSVGGGEQSYSSGGILGAFDSGHFADTGSSFGGGQTTLVQKHIYVHVPPPEPEQHHGHASAPGVVNQKHYKIIFIKAPSAPSYSPAQIAAQQAASQEKTIVYVLVKKPEDQIEQLNAVAAPQLAPSKPEVYFIKYKTQGVSGGQISGGQIGGGSAIAHDAVSGISYDHSQSHSHGQPAAAYGPPH